MQLYKNGFIVKSYEEHPFYAEDPSYRGIGRCFTWPLDTEEDQISRALCEEAMQKWFGYSDQRLWAVPSMEYVLRYLKHCSELHIKTFVMQIESTNGILTTKEEAPVSQIIGYEYADTDMQTSCMRDDFLCTQGQERPKEAYFLQRFNEYGVFSNETAVADYLDFRKNIPNKEAYYAPCVIKISLLALP